MREASPPPNPMVRAVVDYGGLAVFLLAYFVARLVLKQPGNPALLTATWGLVAGSALALLVGLVLEKRVAPLPLFAGLAALIFGGLTLIFHNPVFVKLKPTAINLALAGVMLIGTAMGKNPLRALFATALHLTPEGWRKLTSVTASSSWSWPRPTRRSGGPSPTVSGSCSASLGCRCSACCSP